ncbi:MAG: hypothetical protein QXD03_05080 [Candidatus Anstonellales archaeon]
MKKRLKFKSSMGKMYYVWIGDNGHISIDKKSRWMLEISRMNGDEYYETIFHIYDLLRDRNRNMFSPYNMFNNRICNAFELHKRNSIRLKRMKIRRMKNELEESENGRLAVLNKEWVDSSLYTALKMTMPKLNFMGRLILKTFRSLMYSLMLSDIVIDFNKGALLVTLELVPPDRKSDMYVTFEYRSSRCVFNIGRSWYYKHYLGKLFIVIGGRKYVILGEEKVGNREYYYFIKNSRGYYIKIDKIAITDKNRDKIGFIFNKPNLLINEIFKK